MFVYLVTGAVLVVYLVLVWFLGTWLNLHGADLWILRGVLAALGLLGAGLSLWFYHRNKKAEDGFAESAPGSAQDVDLIVHDAVRRLRSSSQSGASLSKSPVIILIGEPGSIKTTTVVNSALDPELLAGQVYQDNNILPTQTANIWYTRQALFVDCGGSLASDSGRWLRLLHHLQPGRISGAMRGSDQAPRGALVCFPCESFLQPGASETVPAAAKKLNARLQEMSRALGINFPVYVLFTKVDRIPFFGEYVQNLTADEVSQVLGATLPLRPLQGGVYAEEESRRLSKAFDDIFYSLSERRLDLLSRENQADRLPAIYEFPREVRKLRALLVDFLVSLARPSQLQSNPFLRGFYFSGVRAVTSDDVAPAARETAAPPPDAGATRMFSVGQLRQAATPAAPVSRSRKPQWTFLTRLFNDVILKDRVALSTSSISGKVNLLRRIALIVVLTVFGIWAIGLLVSFLGNRALESHLAEAGRQVPSGRLSAGQLASVGDLQRLDQLRQFVAQLSEYEADGAPLHLRWGLYTGNRLYPDARQLYFARFRDLLFGNTQDQIRDVLRNLPESPGPSDSYEKGYTALKSYLITTSNHDKSTVDFLSPVLMSYWQNGRELDPNQVSLAKQQFDFYAGELIRENPYSSDNDPRVVARSREYLAKFVGIDRYYWPLLNEAGKNNPSVSFNRQFKDTADTVISKSEVRGAFTKSGFAATESLLQQPSRYLSNEEWVLGKTASESLDPDKLQQQLRQRYYSDFLEQWRNVLKTAMVLGYGGNFAEAKRKLDKLSGQSSPLLELLWFVSQNTNVERDQIKNAFQPVQTVVAPGGSADNPKFIQSSNQKYVDALRGLRVAIDQQSGNAADPALIAQSNNARAQGLAAAASTLDSANVDQEAHIELAVRELLDEPFKNAEPLINAGPKPVLNGAGQSLCSQFGSLMRFYPFSPNAPDLSLAQLNQMFAPDNGTLWTIYNGPLKQYLVKQGARYEPLPSAVKLNPNFVFFFNKAVEISQTLYPAGTAPPRVSFTLHQTASNVPELALKIGADTLTGTGQSKTFNWTGNEDVQITSNGTPLGGFSGPWAVSHFVADGYAHHTGSNELEYTIKNNDRPVMVDGKPETYNYQLQVSGANVFNPATWSGLRCVPQVVK
jgi:type VI secretion system protein ImpL